MVCVKNIIFFMTELKCYGDLKCELIEQPQIYTLIIYLEPCS